MTEEYIKIRGVKYKVKRKYTKGNHNYIVYKDPDLKPKRWAEYLGIYVVDRVLQDGWIRLNRGRLNPWNPLTYICLAFVIPITVILRGIEGVKECGNPFKEVFDSSYCYKKEEVKYGK